MKKNQEYDRAWKQSLAIKRNQNEYFRRYAPTRRPPRPRYQIFFLGLCYSCNNYGHKAVNCRAYAWNINTWSKNSYENSRYQLEGNSIRKPHEAFDRNYNKFGALNYEFNNFGHTARNCRSKFTSSSGPSKETIQVPKQQKIWKKKQEDLQIEECEIALQAYNTMSHWYVDSGFSKHVTRDKNMFVSLKK